MASARTGAIVLIGAGLFGLEVVSAIRKGRIHVTRRRGVYIYRRKQPRLYWTYVIIMTVMCALFAVVGIAQLSAGSFR